MRSFVAIVYILPASFKYDKEVENKIECAYNNLIVTFRIPQKRIERFFIVKSIRKRLYYIWNILYSHEQKKEARQEK